LHKTKNTGIAKDDSAMSVFAFCRQDSVAKTKFARLSFDKTGMIDQIHRLVQPHHGEASFGQANGWFEAGLPGSVV
jgi:hypothetical protein